ncbi:CPXCG motif-containing cysteine-rich protein [Planctopirus hydrillae]|uniref:CPXCG motif-containing cysteine-rich protein n=1 Tax=Planctopirus hydrillae TaxID=1841610 RepID=A0A1C3EHA0_9PLAN|nr:CPXCG motif-containing cysteine-rich protein [Planctopirus hydrillae]ODA32625.1 hypothetical protein A6X21_19925 [Planctopirus hydrillae]
MTKPKRRRRRQRSTFLEAAYICPSCGEEIIVPVDLSQGNFQEYVEDCPVCCCPNVITVEMDENLDDQLQVMVRPES